MAVIDLDNLTLFSEKSEHVSIFDPTSMAAILEMPQYVAYQKNVAYVVIKVSAKSHDFNIFVHNGCA